ncbi:hypothetical protein RchiOBHm_Chr7g0196981 [Rosa chinensis]|uniref:Uncharacterized protein n=1 Tax=Rosa chinensis TaxID=74649 RepID=A0A2P6P6Q7_ROSCH|nr:hypothetical protein RchiOBHm_Chr7g0196981 [Rosa chinensis]
MVRKAVSRVVRRDAEIHKFISRHLKTETRNMNNENRVCDVQIIDYEITQNLRKGCK